MNDQRVFRSLQSSSFKSVKSERARKIIFFFKFKALKLFKIQEQCRYNTVMPGVFFNKYNRRNPYSPKNPLYHDKNMILFGICLQLIKTNNTLMI